MDEPIPRIRAPKVQARKGPALRCRDLVIGYPEREIATDVQLELDHGVRAAIVGDNGQGKTTFLRTLVNSLKPLAGEVRWGHGCTIGVYAQHIYTSLPDNQTVEDYLFSQAANGKKIQEVLDLAGSFLFRGQAIKKSISVLSGGERARLCMAGILLSDYNILILDEPGNHLDVDTVEALADALLEYQGTVIFTSHDRHFLKTVATCIVEVRDGHVTNYSGQYEAYLYSVNKEIEAGERELAATQKTKLPPDAITSAPALAYNSAPRTEKDIRKEMKTLERTIAQLDAQKKALTDQWLKSTKEAEALRLETEVETVTTQLDEAEERWSHLNEEVEGIG